MSDADRTAGVLTVPRYDYRCEAGHKYERQEPFGSPTEHPCERCGKPARREIVAPTVLFKGQGFYKTSNRSDLRGGSSSSGSSSNSESAPPPLSGDPNPSSSHTPPASNE